MIQTATDDEFKCPRCSGFGHVVRHGQYQRSSDRKVVLRWICRSCNSTFSQATSAIELNEKKRQYNRTISSLLVSGVSQRRISLLLGLNRKTIARKLMRLALEARINQQRYLSQFLFQPFDFIQFDEMETHEHTKMKPLSIPLVVCEKSRKILAFDVASMPAKGLLAKASRKKYGPRPDHRRFASRRIFDEIKPYIVESVTVTSDENPKYPGWLKDLPCTHIRVKGRRGCVAGQGELKKIGFDPLFSLNHTCAMLRANVNRLFRKTWCTTKKPTALLDHLWLYVDFHNRILTP